MSFSFIFVVFNFNLFSFQLSTIEHSTFNSKCQIPLNAVGYDFREIFKKTTKSEDILDI